MTIQLDRVTFQYPDQPAPALVDVTWGVDDGELALITGSSGSGKSTLLRCLNGLLPHFTGGELTGRVVVAGLDTRATGPRALSRVVGFVFQDPDAQHVAPTVEDELAFGMEQHGLPVREMRARVDETLALLGLRHLRGRSIATLSGGERQRVAIGAAIAVRPRVLVLDEPLSQLDPRAADQVVDAVRALNREHEMTVVVAEHRLDRLLPLSDQVRVVELGRFEELPSNMWCAETVSAASAGAGEGLPYRRSVGNDATFGETGEGLEAVRPAGRGRTGGVVSGAFTRRTPTSPGATVEVIRAELGIGRRAVLSGVDLGIGPGEVVALVGPNGSGKTTLLRSLLGALPPLSGRVAVEPRGCRIAYLPQRPGAVLFNETVRGEIAFTRRVNPAAPDSTWLIDALELGPLLDRDPRDLSGGERERAALCAVLAAGPALVLLDEPTRGMDPRRKATLAALLRALAEAGTTVVVATHDLDLAGEVATRAILLESGRVVRDGSPAEVLPEFRGARDTVLDSRP